MLLVLYPVILAAIVWACAYVIGYNSAPQFADSVRSEVYAIGAANNIIYEYWPVIAGVITVWFIISFFFNTRMVAAMAHARPVKRKEEPELYNMLENLCIAQGMKTPQLNIIETHALNAFASGINERTYTVTVTRGLLNRLSKDEVEGVVAHELTHIMNRDVRLMMIAVVFTGMVALAAQLVWSNLRYALYLPRGGNDKKGGALIIMLVIALILWIGYMATIFTRFAISRRREFMADAGAVQMTKNPEAMMRALMRISGRDRIPETTSDVAIMCIENTMPFLGLFATHPPVDRRIKALSLMTGTPVPSISPVADRAEQISNEGGNPWLSRTRPFRQRHNPWTGTNI